MIFPPSNHCCSCVLFLILLNLLTAFDSQTYCYLSSLIWAYWAKGFLGWSLISLHSSVSLAAFPPEVPGNFFSGTKKFGPLSSALPLRPKVSGRSLCSLLALKLHYKNKDFYLHCKYCNSIVYSIPSKTTKGQQSRPTLCCVAQDGFSSVGERSRDWAVCEDKHPFSLPHSKHRPSQLSVCMTVHATATQHQYYSLQTIPLVSVQILAGLSDKCN